MASAIALTRAEIFAMLPKRAEDAHKGDFGKVLVIAGSLGMAGAAHLCALATLRMGAGLVKVLTPEENRIILQVSVPEAIVVPYNSAEEAAACAARECAWADVIAIGPGLGKGEAARSLVGAVLSYGQEKVVIFDADALNLISQIGPETVLPKMRHGIVTPHPGEMSRLIAEPVAKIAEDKEYYAAQFARKTQTVCVLKDHRTVIALPDGTLYRNPTGNSGMATPGSGDVLTGMVAGLAAIGVSEALVAACAVYVHGASGDIAAETYGKQYMNAGEIIRCAGIFLKEAV